MIKIASDLGRSRVRLIVNEMSNAYVSAYKEIPADAATRDDSHKPYEDFIIDSSPIESLCGRRFVRGETADYHKGVTVTADNQGRKFEQEATFVNMAAALAESIIRNSDKYPPLNPQVKLGLCIPCAEFFSDGASQMKKTLAGSYIVTFPITGMSVAFKLQESDIAITPEGVVALYALPKADRVSATKGKLAMILDCGYGSLDITLLRNGLPIGDTARSFPVGGITLEAMLSSELERSGVFASTEFVRTVLYTGALNHGNELLDVSETVNTCKVRFAKMLVQRAKSVLIEAGLNYTEVSAICPIGRCFNKAANEGIVSLVSLVAQEWGCDLDLIDISYNDDLEFANVRGVAAAM